MSSMTTVFGLARRSLTNRAATALLTILSIAISVALLLGVERIRTEARGSFASTISGTDLIVGARSAISIYCSILYSGSAMQPTTSPGKATRTLLRASWSNGRYRFHWVIRIAVSGLWAPTATTSDITAFRNPDNLNLLKANRSKMFLKPYWAPM